MNKLRCGNLLGKMDHPSYYYQESVKKPGSKMVWGASKELAGSTSGKALLMLKGIYRSFS